MLDVRDSGAAIHVCRTIDDAVVPESVRTNTLGVRTANGPVIPPFKCDRVQKVRLDDGTIRSLILEGCLVMDTCAHNLISLGKLARDNDIGTYIGAGTNGSYLQFSDKAKGPLINAGIILIPSHKASVQVNTVAHGTRTTKRLAADVVHGRGNHAHHQTLRAWHQCTADIPEEWSRAVVDTPCDSCLKAVAPNVPSDKHTPIVTTAGELISYDVYYIGVKHVHGGQS